MIRIRMGEGKMKQVITDNRTSFVYYINGTNEIFGSWKELNQPLASIEEVKNHRDIWDYPLIVKEGKFAFKEGHYVKI